MIEISGVKLPCGSGKEALQRKVEKLLKGRRLPFRITKHSIDARRKPELYDVFSVRIRMDNPAEEEALLKRLPGNAARRVSETVWKPAPAGEEAPSLKQRPVVTGSGPAGLFAALTLAELGFRPILIERGAPVEERVRDVEAFWRQGKLKADSNIQFGEGGAGTFSDGKLTTNVRDAHGRNARVLQQFVEAGAPKEILYEQYPHIGTDLLRQVIVRLREKLLELGGEVHFHTCLKDLCVERGRLTGVVVETAGRSSVLKTDVLVLAPGHSARDTFRRLRDKGVPLTQKAFALGFRLSHPQSMINSQQYGTSDPDRMARLNLPPANYKLTHQLESGRAAYSFCMCPGGYVVNASSREGFLAVNGMSCYARDSARANSAIVLTVNQKDFGSDDPLAGVQFQERLEKRAWDLAEGRIPVQKYPDFESAFRASLNKSEERSLPPSSRGEKQSSFLPLSEAEEKDLCLCGRSAYAPLHTLLPKDLTADLIEGMRHFDHVIPGFAGEAAYVCGLESRTSSPVRIERDDSFESSLKGLYPCGEGAGYAGGIMSAAIDGIKVAEAIASRFRPSPV